MNVNPRRIFKAGREKKIFEVTDSLQVNTFSNTNGVIGSTIHGKMSRINFTLIDVTKGTKGDAIILKFNFKVKEWKQLAKAISVGGNAFMENNKYGWSFTKANPYKKMDNNNIEVKKIKISYEQNMKTPNKWKLEISEGKAKSTDSFGYDTKSYQLLQTSCFFMNNDEIRDMLYDINSYTNNWEQWAFGEYMKSRQAFENKARKNNYEYENIDNWNTEDNASKFFDNSIVEDNNGKFNEDSIVENNASKFSNNKEYFCEECGSKAHENIAKISKVKANKILCAKCLNKIL